MAEREIFDHKIHDGLHWMDVKAVDEPGAGGANHKYRIDVYVIQENGEVVRNEHTLAHSLTIDFQHGPLKEVSANGILESALIAILLDRQRSFNRGEFSCRENSLTITHLEEALHWQGHRSRVRKFQNVEGLNKKHAA